MIKKGFTLIELLIVISIIGILSTLVYVNWANAQLKARDNKRKADLQAISGALTLYYTDSKHFPDRPPNKVNPSLGLSRIGFEASGLRGLEERNYIDVIPLDPLNRAKDKQCNYVYLQNNTSSKPQDYKLVSTSAEAIAGSGNECEFSASEFGDPQKSCKQFQVSSSSSAKKWRISTFNDVKYFRGCANNPNGYDPGN